MSMDDIGARRLMASILKKACDDYAGDKGCPQWCAFKDSCNLSQVDAQHCDAKRFIHSAWCATLCDALNVDHEEYVVVCIKKHRLSKNTFKYVEQEIRQYKNNLKELNRLKNEIIQEAPEKQNGRSSGLGDSTAAKAGGSIARQARQQLESQTGKSVVSGDNYLPPKAIKAVKSVKDVKLVKKKV